MDEVKKQTADNDPVKKGIGRKIKKSPLLFLENVSYRVENGAGLTGSKEIIKDLSLSLYGNRFVAVTGQNGSGKSTLAKLIAGILKPDSGKILFSGKDITKKSVTDRARLGIGYGFQQPVRFKGLGVLNLLRLAAGGTLCEEKACWYLTQVGLEADAYLERQMDDGLSGGEMKRIEIATVLARKAKLSIFDEPEAGIDLWSFCELLSVFERLREKGDGGSILIISHQERILKLADEIVVLADGKIAARGSGEEIWSRLKEIPPRFKEKGRFEWEN